MWSFCMIWGTVAIVFVATTSSLPWVSGGNLRGLTLIRSPSRLTVPQWHTIDRILHVYPQSPESQTCKRLIFHHYREWAIHQSYEFRRFHRYKCRHISPDELHSYALYGLHDAIEHYLPKRARFNTYAEKYVYGQLYRGMTELQPITLIPKRRRQDREWIRRNIYRHKQALRGPIPYDTTHEQQSSSHPHQSHQSNRDTVCCLLDQWAELQHGLDPVAYRTLSLKYDVEFNTVRSNKEVAVLMACSEETVRTRLHRVRTMTMTTYPILV